MRKTILLGCCLLLAGAMQAASRDFTQYVNLFVGTAGHGHTHPGAVVPNGMIQPGPDSRQHGWDACSGYYYEDTTLNGFSHTRLSGTGCADLGDFLLMPTVGPQVIAYNAEKEPAAQTMPYASPFNHRNETAEPGYYSVKLDRYDVRTEITSTARAAIYRITYPQTDQAGMILDLDYSIQEQLTRETDFRAVDNYTLCARRRTAGWAYNHEIFFYAKFSQPFTYEVVRDTVRTSKRDEPRCKVLLHFPAGMTEPLMVKTSISAVDYEGAKANLTAEIPDWDFDRVRQAAHDKWNKVLGRIELPESLQGGAQDEQLRIFYTALYHAHIAPALATDVDGRYRAMDLSIRRADDRTPNYTVFSLWDTFRALHPLLTITDPERNQAYIRCLIRKGKEGGIVPKWELMSNYTGCMIGYHYVSLAADAYAKGQRDFDLGDALAAGVRLAEFDTSGITQVVPRWKVRDELMPQARRFKNELGYIPCDLEHESVAKALEYAYNDWCIAQMAKAAGDQALTARYEKFAKAYRHYFDPSVRFMRGKDSHGNWRTPFDPQSSTHRADDYCEGTAWQWTWFAPHDVDGLVALMGGKAAFAEKLDSLFNASSEITGDNLSPDIAGFIGQYAHGNEPGHHTTHLYNYVGRPWRTQELVDSVLYSQYRNAPDGLSGNEDCGQMSAWFVLNALGFYQVCPGRPVYSLGRPLFPEATIHLPGGKTFRIVAKNNSRTAKYIKSAKLNGKALKTPFFTHEQLAAGGVLEVEMSQRPTRWGR